ncbi:MAG: DUF4832 domain-containing protein [Kiritimatiellae bacterium]|nr:DUF4832 domain-containing protein [Kiritimatiellia bacterium]
MTDRHTQGILLRNLLLTLCAGVVLSLRGGTVRPDLAYTDGKETITENPARGMAGGGWTIFKPEGLPAWHGHAGFHSSLWELSRFSGGREQGGKRPDPKRVGTADIPLTEAMKRDVRRYLDETRMKGGTLIVRLGYTWSDQAGCEPSDFECLLGHVKTLAGIIGDYPDVVVGVEAGVAGPWGEMHSSDYCKAPAMNRILKSYLDTLPETIPVLVRAPAYFCKLAETNTVGLLDRIPFKDRYLRRMGMYNDGYLGTWWDYGTWAGDFTRERGCRLLAACKAPYGGEMAYIDRKWLEKNRKLFDPEQWNLVKEWYTTHLSYLRNITEGGHTLAEFLKKDLTFRNATYRFEGMPDLAEYEGESMSKFLMDHMGYRYVIRDARLPDTLQKGAPLTLQLTVENTGFAALLLDSVTELLLMREGSPCRVLPAAGCDWRELNGGDKQTVRLTAKVPETLEAGPYTLALRVRVPCKDEGGEGTPRRAIRFANPGVWDAEWKANRLAPVNVE